MPTSISLTPTTLTFTFLGETLTIQGSVRDQNGGTVSGSVIWASSGPEVVTVSTNGVVTAVANGTAQITATFGSLSASASANVQQVPSQLVTAAGDGQAGTVGQALAQVLVAQANDQGGNPVEGAGITFAVASGGGALTVTSATAGANGTASTAWTLGTSAGAQTVTASLTSNLATTTTFAGMALADISAALSVASGDTQSGPRGQPLTSPVVALVADQHANPVAGQSVTFGVTGGGGSVDPAVSTTGEDGTASTTWTLGPMEGTNGLTASVTGLTDATFTAIATGLPELSVGNLVVTPTISATTQEFTVTAAVTNSGDGPTAVPVSAELLIDGASFATVDLGLLAAAELGTATFGVSSLAAGDHALRVTVDPANQIVENDESNNTVDGAVTTVVAAPLADGVPTTSLAGGAGSQTYFTFQVPAPALAAAQSAAMQNTLALTLSGGAGDADLFVRFGELPTTTDFDCSSVTGSNAESCIIDDPAAGNWFALIVGASAFSGVSLQGDFTGVQPPPPPGGFNIELAFISPISDGVKAAFEAAERRWEAIIRGNLPDIDFASNPLASGGCTIGQPEVNDVVDDIRIYVKIFEIDGPGRILGQAGPCFLRDLPGSLPVLGTMQFDELDMAQLDANGTLTKVIIHEMGHVLGIGTLWSTLEFVIDPSLPNSQGIDTYFRGLRSIAAFDAAGGTAYTGKKVPVENQLGPGSGDVHWRESVLKTEAMTPQTTLTGFDPLSAITTESLADMGYEVDSSKASPFTLTLPAAAPAEVAAGSIRYIDDIRKGPMYVVDENGRIVRVIRQ